MAFRKMWAALLVVAVLALGLALRPTPFSIASLFGVTGQPAPQRNTQPTPQSAARSNPHALSDLSPLQSREGSIKKADLIRTIRGNTVSLRGQALTNWQKWREGVEQLSLEHPGQVYIGGAPLGNRVCLTFDDGPDRRNTPRILDILRDHGVAATFFVLGENAEAFPQVLQRMDREGHLVASHSFTHPRFTKATEAAIRSELDRTARTLVKTIGKAPALFRPPYGDIDRAVLPLLEQGGYKTVIWSLDPFDWDRKTPEEISDYVIENARAGDIVLLHSGGNGGATAKALPSMIAGLRQKGFVFVTVAELLAVDDYQ
ncbi:polysaccharide deacetylase family protein [Heliobacterium undosum]|uniref:Polysaccharide deacetylase family protein n=1 Tax=Heliomicrobium undosum TaxID=121734 RepID=A0A845L3M3_9FIRM|nr:polysaccharide deacetylase family protein [Heliomicrobium undosum]MZP29729.1 polysaccharide deacetylase family protein [Heliomicrobium undosum]